MALGMMALTEGRHCNQDTRGEASTRRQAIRDDSCPPRRLITAEDSMKIETEMSVFWFSGFGRSLASFLLHGGEQERETPYIQ
jgi:hypothetical protein